MPLLLADLRALANLPTSGAGRRLLFATLVGLAVLASMAWLTSSELLANPRLLERLAREAFPGGSSADSLRLLLGVALMPCPVVATWIGLATAQRQLFESPELELWRQAPIAPWRPALQVLLRASFVALLWAVALAGPMVCALLGRAGSPGAAYSLVPLALLACTVPVIGTLLAFYIVLMRFCSGRWMRLLFVVLSALASVGFSTWMVLGMLLPARDRLQAGLAVAASPTRQPWMVETSAELLSNAARGSFAGGPFTVAIGWLAATMICLWAIAWLHPRAVEQHRLSEPPLLRWRRGSWPAGVSGSIRSKEFAQVTQQPSALLGFLVFGILVIALVHKQVLVHDLLRDPGLPRDLAHLGAMVYLWFLAVLLVLYAHMGRLALADGAQWALYTVSPARPLRILWGKLQAVALFLAWPVLLVGAASAHQYGVRPTTMCAFVAIALAGTCAALGVLAAVGTWPLLMRPDESGQIAHGGPSFVAAMLLVVLFYVVAAPAAVAWRWLAEVQRRRLLPEENLLAYVTPLLLTAALTGLTAGGLGLWFGARNYRRLLQPR